MPSLARIIHPLQPGWSGTLNHADFELSPFWRDWLFDSGSLTARLKALNIGQFWVQVLGQFQSQPSQLERQEMQLGGNERVWAREVILHLGQQPIIYARTAIPFTTLTGSEKRLLALGNTSLGSYLFRQPSLQRGAMKVNRCTANHYSLHWARRSVFHLQHKPLMVSEAFSSVLPDLIKTHASTDSFPQ